MSASAKRRPSAVSSALLAVAALAVLIPGAPLGLITTGVQALAGVLLPSATVLLLLLCNDHDVLGPWVNPRWLNAIAAVVVAVLVALSSLLTVTTVFPHASIGPMCLAVLGLLTVTLLGLAVLARHRPHPVPEPALDRRCWTTPRLETLRRPTPSRLRQIALIGLRVQVLFAAALLLAKVIQLGVHA